MLSIIKCVNQCEPPRPCLKVYIRVTMKDESGGEAYLSLTDTIASHVFGIDVDSADIFKEYFFQHGVFLYRSLRPKV
jgi:hypothetical protein